jgi:non-specific serine/threonine protein kinase/serine/threonine-protein kinase
VRKEASVSIEPPESTVGWEAGDPTRTVRVSGKEAGTEIGPYRLVRLLGEGGMGVVYHAQQTQPIRRDVALKIIKPGMDSKQVIARFESERQALAVMDHANIARVFDAGTTAAGLPYFVMELVAGIPITRYCDSKRLTVGQRVALMIPVCRAIQHAHQKGIIHRDLKPANILVTEQEGKPFPKVIDFGLAKALGPQVGDVTMLTSVGTVVGTLDYMSPEQADIGRPDIDTRTDVYSLGAVLYELLSGTTPLESLRMAEAGYVEALRRIRDEEAPPPSTRLRRSGGSEAIAACRQSDPTHLPKLLQHELDWIAMKALEKDPTRRYETVNGLARDLERYQAGEPVEAAPPSVRYRAGKFMRKYRAPLAAAGSIMVLLVAGIGATSWMAIRATRAEQEARAVNDFLRNDLLAQAGASGQASPNVNPDPHLEVRTALDRAATRIEGRFPTQPAVEASIRQTISEAYFDLGLYPESRRQSDRALDLRRRVLGDKHLETLTTMFTLASILSELGQVGEAESLFSRVLEARQRRLGEDDADTLKTAGKLGQAYMQEGKFAQAERLLKQTLERQRRVLGAEDYETLGSTFMLGNLYMREARYPEAAALLSSVYDTDRRVLGEEHPETLRVANSLAGVYLGQNKLALAEPLFVQILDVNRRMVGDEHPRTLMNLNNLAVLYHTEGKYAQAASLYVKVLETRRRLLGNRHPDTLMSAGNLGTLYRDADEYSRAEPLLMEAIDGRRQVLGSEHADTAVSLHEMGKLHADRGRFAQAAPLFEEALVVRRKVLGDENADTIETKVHLGEARLMTQGYAEAEAQLRAALVVLEKTAPEEWIRQYCRSLLGATLAAQKKYVEAEPMLVLGYEGMLQRQDAITAPDRRYLRRIGERVVEFYEAWGKRGESEKWKVKVAGAAR